MGHISPTLPVPHGAVRRPHTLPLPAVPESQSPFGDLLGALLDALRPLAGGVPNAPAPAQPQNAPDRATDANPLETPAPPRRSAPDRADDSSRATDDDANATTDPSPTDDATALSAAASGSTAPASAPAAAPTATPAPDDGTTEDPTLVAPAPAAVVPEAQTEAGAGPAQAALSAGNSPAPAPADVPAQAQNPQAAPAADAAAAPTPPAAPDPAVVEPASAAATAVHPAVPNPGDVRPAQPTLPAPDDAGVSAANAVPDPAAAPLTPAPAADAAAALPAVAAVEGSALNGSPRDGGSPSNPQTGGREPAVASLERTAASTAAARSARAARPDPSAMVERILRAAQLSRAGGPTRIRLVLQPPELGTLRLTVSVRNQAVSAHVTAETAGAHALLTGNLTALREALEHHGLQLGSFQVSVSQQGQDAPAYDAPPRGGAPAGNGAGTAAEEASLPSVRPAPLSIGRYRINLVA